MQYDLLMVRMMYINALITDFYLDLSMQCHSNVILVMSVFNFSEMKF